MQIKPESTAAPYNKSSSPVQIGEVQGALQILKKAIEVDGSLKEKARMDLDFQKIKTLNGSRQITLSPRGT